MRRAFFAVLVFCRCLWGGDELLMDAQSSIVPKIALLDRELEKKLVSDRVVIVVACENSDMDGAKAFASQIMAKTNGRIGKYPLSVVTVEFSALSRTEMTLLYLFRGSDSSIKKATQIAKARGVVSFASDYSALEQGVVLSMNIERSAVILLNRSCMREAGVRFVDSFYKIARIVE